MHNRVLILRDPALCGELISLLRADGADFECLPVTRTEFLQPQKISIFKFSWIAFTSANGVRGLFRALESSAHVLPLNVRLAAVGKATADTIHELFSRKVDIVAEAADGASLAQSLITSLPAGTELLYPCPGGHDSEFAQTCRAAGLNIHVLPVYQTLALGAKNIQNELASLGEFDAAIFYAPSAVKAFHAAIPAPWNFPSIAIGTTTEHALQEVGQTSILKSESTQPCAIAKAVRALHSLEWETQNA